MTTLNNIVLLISGLMLMAGIGLLISVVFEYRKFTLKKLKTQEQLIIAEIKRRKQANVQSLYFSEAYNNDLNYLLKTLEGEHGKERRTKRN